MSGINHGGLLANLRNVAAINWLAADQRARLAGQQTAAQAPGYRSSTEPRYSLLSQSISALIFCHVPTMLLLTWLIFSQRMPDRNHRAAVTHLKHLHAVVKTLILLTP